MKIGRVSEAGVFFLKKRAVRLTFQVSFSCKFCFFFVVVLICLRISREVEQAGGRNPNDISISYGLDIAKLCKQLLG